MNDLYKIEVIYEKNRDAYLVSAIENNNSNPRMRFEYCELKDIEQTVSLVSKTIKQALGVE